VYVERWKDGNTYFKTTSEYYDIHELNEINEKNKKVISKDIKQIYPENAK
jgi:hypothetical protein